MTNVLNDLLTRGLNELRKREPDYDLRRRFYRGDHDLPYAPPGTAREYLELRKCAPLPLIRLAVKTPSQRVNIGGVRINGAEQPDILAWQIFRWNNLDARQKIVTINALVEGRGVVSVWPNPDRKDRPFIRIEDPRYVYVERDPADPFRALWALKIVERAAVTPLGRIETVVEAYLYHGAHVWKYEAPSPTANFEFVERIHNPLGRVPFVEFSTEVEPDGSCHSHIDALIPMQRAIDAMRFNLLLAAQFAAYRQRIVSGYDPVLRDEETGEPIWQKDSDGNVILDEHGQPKPILISPGRAGVDRLLSFPGADTKVWDLPESDLNNYVVALTFLVATFASTAQVPPQYLIGDFKNVSGDLMTATEATLRSFVRDLQIALGEGWEEVFRLAWLAMGRTVPDTVEIIWTDAEPKSLQQIASAASQMIPNGAPLEMFLEMMPGADPEKVKRWLRAGESAIERARRGDLSGLEYGPKPDPLGEEAEDDSTA